MKGSTPVGWQGIVLLVPRDWSLVAVSGDHKKGYFRVDGPYSTSAEVRWAATKSAPDLTAKAREFLRELERACRKRRIAFTSRIKKRALTESEIKTGGSSVGFSWRGDRNGYGRLLFCGVCRRLVIAQVVSPLEEDASGIAGQILGTLCDHGEVGWQTWALYDLQVALPSDFRLDKYTLMSGYILLSFKSREAEIRVERWGLANMLLKPGGLESWFKADSLPDYRGFEVQIEPDGGEHGHEVLNISGRRRGVLQTLRTAARALTLRPLPQQLAGYVWHCPDSNRLFAVRVAQARPEMLAREIKDRLACHRVGDDP